MDLTYFAEGNISTIQDAIQQASSSPQTKAIIVLIADTQEFDVSQLSSFIKQVDKPVVGGVFPGVIYKNRKYNTGFIVASLHTKAQTLTVPNISKMGRERKVDLLLKKHKQDFAASKTIFVFVDGLAQRINAFIEELYFTLGTSYSYIGGGAGSLSLQQQPCLFSNQGVMQDAAMLVGIEEEAGVGVAHGWEGIAGPYHVTKSERTKVVELDFTPTFEVYKEVVDKHSGKSISADNFFEIAKAFPFGITRDADEIIVRDPLMVGEKDSLVCVGEVEKGDYLSILYGNNQSLLLAANKAAQDAKTGLFAKTKCSKVTTVFFVDCISRVLFLEGQFEEELTRVQQATTPTEMFGILSLGEIANNTASSLDFYNKTAVVGCF